MRAFPDLRLPSAIVLVGIGVAMGVGAPANADSTVETTPDEARSTARNMVSMVEACFTDTEDYRECTKTVRGSLGTDTGLPIVQRNPRPGEVRVTSRSPHTYKVVSVDGDGSGWIITKSADARFRRTCRLPSGKSCTPKNW